MFTSPKPWRRRVLCRWHKKCLLRGIYFYRENTPGDRGEKMKATTHYPMMILFFVSLLIGQFGCAHVPQHSYQQTWVCSADGPEFDAACIKESGFRVAKDFTKRLAGDTSTGAVIGGLVGAVVGVGVTVGTSGAVIVLLPYFTAGGAAVGGAVGGISGGVEGGTRSKPPPDDGGIMYDIWKDIRFVQVDSVKPTLQWKSFPTAKDIKADKTGDLGRISEVTYDLKIWKAEDPPNEDIIHGRTQLKNPSHKIESPLIPLTRYFWSVRVRFKLDGRDIETNWSTCCPPFYTTP